MTTGVWQLLGLAQLCGEHHLCSPTVESERVLALSLSLWIQRHCVSDVLWGFMEGLCKNLRCTPDSMPKVWGNACVYKSRPEGCQSAHCHCHYHWCLWDPAWCCWEQIHQLCVTRKQRKQNGYGFWNCLPHCRHLCANTNLLDHHIYQQ